MGVELCLLLLEFASLPCVGLLDRWDVQSSFQNLLWRLASSMS